MSGDEAVATVVLLGTLDTKRAAYDFFRRRIEAAGCEVTVVDAGVMSGSETGADVTADEVARAAGTDRSVLASAGDRGRAVEAMTRGAVDVVGRLYRRGAFDAIAGLGGSGGTALISAAMRALPRGVPKLIVSTKASGDTRPYVGTSDIVMVNSVVDIDGMNSISERILSNAAAAVAGMARAATGFRALGPRRPRIGATMSGVTTPCVTVARDLLESRGYEVLVFAATGPGGQTMEDLMRDRVISAVLDVTTTALADELMGSPLATPPDRLETAGALGLPQVVSLGALDMVHFGPVETVPHRFRDRTLYKHNAAVTLMRTSPSECAELGRRIARKLNPARGPVTVFIPLRGVSMIDVEGGPFYDPVADAALFDQLKAGLTPDIEVVECDTTINDPAFARAMADRLDTYCRAWLPARPREGTP